MINFLKKLFFSVAVLVCCSVGIQSVQAIGFDPPPFNDLAYKGQFYNQSVSDPITIPAGSSKEVIVRFKNAGTKTWEASGTNYVSVYTVDPNYRKSVFSGSDWISSSQVGKILKTTKVGEIAEVKINLHAPEKPEEYVEKFYFASENRTWIKSSYFYLKIKVVEGEILKQVQDDPDTTSTDEATPPNLPLERGGTSSDNGASSGEIDKDDLKAQIVGYTKKTMIANQGGDDVKFKIKYKNTGEDNWDEYELYGELQNSGEVITHSSWESEKHILTNAKEVLKNQDTGWVSFTMKAPSKVGTYKINFNLGINSKLIAGSNTVINLKVLKDASSSYNPVVEVKSDRVLVEEPNIRVRVTSPKTVVKFKSTFEYQIYEGDKFKGDLPANTLVDLNYYGHEDGVYSFKSKELSFSAKEKIRFVPSDMNHYFNIPTLARTVTWKGSRRFDTYRGIMEYVYSDKKDVMYIVNELSLSSYIAGIGEMSDLAPFEYMKTIMVAARSYAYYHIYHGVPRDERTFDVYASTIDQLYLGYNHELMAPNAVKAQKETKGEIVTYKNNPVVTPYFGHSDGYTRYWKQVWGGANKDWIKPVKTPYDTGKSMFGHGVGISMDDAVMRARKDDWTYIQLLKYYYTGVEVERVY